MKDTSLNKWTVTSFVILIAVIIGFLWFTSQQGYGAVVVTIVGVVLGFLLKTIGDTITISQRRQWDLDDIARERTLNYYETKLGEMSLFAVNELEKLLSLKLQAESEYYQAESRYWRVNTGNWKITREWLTSSESARTFSQVIGDAEIVDAYTKTINQFTQLNELIGDLNSGKFDTYDHAQLKKRLRDEMDDYMDKLKDFQQAIEHVRLMVLRGELSLNKKNS